MRTLRLAVVLMLAACGASTPDPDPVKLAPPAPPEARAGEIRIFGRALPTERAEEIRERLRKTEPRIVSAYQSVLGQDPYAAGTLQLRLSINEKGEVASLVAVQAEVNTALLEERIPPILRSVRFPAGPEAFAFYTLAFQPDPLEVIGVEPEFALDPPALAVRLLNRSAFRLSAVSITVRVQGPERAAPLRISRRRIRADFEPGGSRTVRVPVGSEWASERYSFLVDVRPAQAN